MCLRGCAPSTHSQAGCITCGWMTKRPWFLQRPRLASLGPRWLRCVRRSTPPKLVRDFFGFHLGALLHPHLFLIGTAHRVLSIGPNVSKMWKSSPEIDMASQKSKKEPASHSLDELGEMMKKSMSSIFNEDGSLPSLLILVIYFKKNDTHPSLNQFHHSGSDNSPKHRVSNECITRGPWVKRCQRWSHYINDRNRHEWACGPQRTCSRTA